MNKCKITNGYTYLNNWNARTLKEKVDDWRKNIRSTTSQDYGDSNSSSNDVHESASDISIYSDYNKKLSSQHICNSIISQPVDQETDEVNAIANAL